MNVKNSLLWGAALLLLLMAVFSSPLAAQDSAEGRFASFTLEHDGDTRSYWLYIPTGYDPSEPIAALLVFHGAGGSGPSMAIKTGFNERAERDTVLVVYPEGPRGYWDYGAGTEEWRAVPGKIFDDPGFVSALLNQLAEDYPIAGFYAAGYSNGARMAWRVACELGDQWAGVAAVSGAITGEVVSNCPPESQVSIIYFHGTEDLTVPWDGKSLTLSGISLGDSWSAPDTANFWAQQNSCAPEPEIIDLEDLNPDDNVILQLARFTDCAAETAVEFYAVIGGGHGWPGGVPNLVPNDWQPSGYASDYIWAFFGFGTAQG